MDTWVFLAISNFPGAIFLPQFFPHLCVHLNKPWFNTECRWIKKLYCHCLAKRCHFKIFWLAIVSQRLRNTSLHLCIIICSMTCTVCLYLVRQGVKNPPEELLGEEELLLRGRAEAAHARRQTVVLPVLLVVVDQELEEVRIRKRSRRVKIVILLHCINKRGSERLTRKWKSRKQESTCGLLKELVPSAHPPAEEFCSIRWAWGRQTPAAWAAAASWRDAGACAKRGHCH